MSATTAGSAGRTDITVLNGGPHEYVDHHGGWLIALPQPAEHMHSSAVSPLEPWARRPTQATELADCDVVGIVEGYRALLCWERAQGSAKEAARDIASS